LCVWCLVCHYRFNSFLSFQYLLFYLCSVFERFSIILDTGISCLVIMILWQFYDMWKSLCEWLESSEETLQKFYIGGGVRTKQDMEELRVSFYIIFNEFCCRLYQLLLYYYIFMLRKSDAGSNDSALTISSPSCCHLYLKVRLYLPEIFDSIHFHLELQIYEFCLTDPRL